MRGRNGLELRNIKRGEEMQGDGQKKKMQTWTIIAS
jgi:hypothetical protein